MTELRPCDIDNVNGGYLNQVMRFVFNSAAGGMVWDGIKYSGSQMIGLNHNASNFGAATNRL